VAVGDNGIILTSSDGNTWTSPNFGTSVNLRDVTFGNSLFVAVGESGTILTSTDGSSWSPQTSGTTESLDGITFLRNHFVVVEGDGTVHTTKEESTWTSQTSDGTANLEGIASGGSGDEELFIAVGDGGTIQISSAPPIVPAFNVLGAVLLVLLLSLVLMGGRFISQVRLE